MTIRRRYIVAAILIAMAAAIGSIASYFILKKELSVIVQAQQDQFVAHKRTNQFLLSTIDWSTRRQKTILYFRDLIVEAKQSTKQDLEYEHAYLIAECIVVEAEKYPSIDEFFVMSVIRRESCFNDSAKSNMGAIGLMQLMPQTARLLCGFFNITYHDSILYNPEINIKFGTKFLEILYATYTDYGVSLAGYNGGPYSAYYYKIGDKRLSDETTKFVPYILAKWEEYKSGFETFRIDSTTIQMR